MRISLAVLFTLVIYEVTDLTYEIEVYDYEEELKIEVVCPEGVFSSDCLEPREEEKDTISIDDIKNCASNSDYQFL